MRGGSAQGALNISKKLCCNGCREAMASGERHSGVQQDLREGRAQEGRGQKRKQRGDPSQPRKVGPVYVQVVTRLAKPRPSGARCRLSAPAPFFSIVECLSSACTHVSALPAFHKTWPPPLHCRLSKV
jgi:hypothetical protein